MKNDSTPDFDTVARIIEMLRDLTPDQQAHVLRTVHTWLNIPIAGELQHRRNRPASTAAPDYDGPGTFSDRELPTPKEFMLEKEPRADVERLACLAYYLTHYRDTPEFRTADLSKLNTEAAQRKFSNISQTAKNATRDGFLAPSSKSGYKQLSAYGEQYITSLPDHDSAKTVRKKMKPRRTRRTPSKKTKRSA